MSEDHKPASQTTDLLGLSGVSNGLGCLLMVVALIVLMSFERVLDLIEVALTRCPSV